MGELEAKKQDGTKFDVQLSANTVKSESGEPLFLMASFVDITERNQTHEALRESEVNTGEYLKTYRMFIMSQALMALSWKSVLQFRTYLNTAGKS